MNNPVVLRNDESINYYHVELVVSPKKMVSRICRMTVTIVVRLRECQVLKMYVITGADPLNS